MNKVTFNFCFIDLILYLSYYLDNSPSNVSFNNDELSPSLCDIIGIDDREASTSSITVMPPSK